MVVAIGHSVKWPKLFMECKMNIRSVSYIISIYVYVYMYMVVRVRDPISCTSNSLFNIHSWIELRIASFS